jgi:hypothetical protein
LEGRTALVAVILCALVAALGAVGVVSPARLVALARRFDSSRGIYVATALRLVLGATLIVAAPTSRAPGAVRILGVVIFLAGVITPWFGLERFRRILTWWSTRSALLQRAWAGLALVLGLFLTYAVLPGVAE